MANPSTYPSDGRITSLQSYTAGFAGTELLPIVAPGNSSAGVNYKITTQALASGLISVLPVEPPNTVLAGPASGTSSGTATFRALVSLDLPGLVRNGLASSYIVATTDINKLLGLGGTPGTAVPFVLSLGSASGYTTSFITTAYNESTRGWQIAPNGVATFILYPQQTVQIFNDNNNWRVSPNSQRWLLTSNATFFVDGTLGSDSNDGLAIGAAALQTLQRAIIVAQGVDRNNNVVNIKLAAQTFIGAPNVMMMAFNGLPVGEGGFNISGDTTVPSNTVLSVGANGIGLFASDNGGYGVVLSNVQLVGTSGSLGISVAQDGVCDIGANVTFGTFGAGSVHMQYAKGGFGNITAPYSITGGAAAHLELASKSLLNNSVVSTVSNSPNFTTAFVQIFGGAVGNFGGASYVGTATGLKYTLSEGASVLTNGVDLNSIFPGSINGTPFISAVDYGMNYPAGTASATNLPLVSTGANSAAFQSLPLAGLTTINNSTILGNNTGTTASPVALSGTAVAGITEQGLTLLNVVQANGSISMQDTSSFGASYSDYLVTFDNILPNTNSASLQCLFQLSGAFQTTSYLNQAGGATTYIDLLGGATNVATTAGYGYTAQYLIPNVNSTTSFKYFYGRTNLYLTNAAIIAAGGNFGAIWNGTTNAAVTGLKIQVSTGTMTGAMMVYGYKTAL